MHNILQYFIGYTSQPYSIGRALNKKENIRPQASLSAHLQVGYQLFYLNDTF